VENIFAGTATKGSAGENVAEMFFCNLPSDWLVRNLPVNNKRVEYAVRLPDGLALPIDIKWPATDVLQQFLCCEDDLQRRKLKATIQSITRTRALEMRKYLDPTMTTRFGLVVVSEPVFELCSEILPLLSQEGIVLVSCNMLLPYMSESPQMSTSCIEQGVESREFSALLNAKQLERYM
jgi:DNA anti-recombination protein RmuC